MHAGVLSILRTGEWLTYERVRRIAVALICAYAVAVGYLVITANGAVDASGRPLGTDFSNVYAAGTYVLEGRPQAPFDPALQYAREQAIFGPDTPFYGWHYPPFFLFVAAGLALLPYGLALAVWQIATFLLYLVSIRAILAATPISSDANGEHRAVPILALLLAAAFPAVFVNVRTQWLPQRSPDGLRARDARSRTRRGRQAAVSLALGATLIWLWRSAASFALKASALCLSAMLASPYGYDYDMTILAPAIAFLASDGLARGWRPWEKTLLAALWFMPIAARGLTLATFIPLSALSP
jgi:Glycosyltransferase family 87